MEDYVEFIGISVIWKVELQGVRKLVCQLYFEISHSYVDVLQIPFNQL